MITKYLVSKTEIIRREKAFFSLSISLFLASMLASILFNFPISYLFFSLFALALLLANLWIKKFFDSYLKMKTYLSDKLLVRADKKYLIKNIKKIKIKKTTNNTIREISIYFKNGNTLLINGLEKFEKFTSNLLKALDKNITIKNIREPMDFDSPLFYPILGFILSFSTVYFFKLMTNFTYQTMKIVLYLSIIYISLISAYFLISKPISKRY